METSDSECFESADEDFQSDEESSVKQRPYKNSDSVPQTKSGVSIEQTESKSSEDTPEECMNKLNLTVTSNTLDSEGEKGSGLNNGLDSVTDKAQSIIECKLPVVNTVKDEKKQSTCSESKISPQNTNVEEPKLVWNCIREDEEENMWKDDEDWEPVTVAETKHVGDDEDVWKGNENKEPATVVDTKHVVSEGKGDDVDMWKDDEKWESYTVEETKSKQVICDVSKSNNSVKDTNVEEEENMWEDDENWEPAEEANPNVNDGKS